MNRENLSACELRQALKRRERRAPPEGRGLQPSGHEGSWALSSSKRNRSLRIVLVAALATSLPLRSIGAQTNPPPEDEWITSTVQYPAPFRADQVRSNAFAGLQAEVALSQLKILSPTVAVPGESNVQLHVSVDAPGHWPARDWRTQPMSRHQIVWEAVVPVFDLDLPLVYFLSAPADAGPAVSPMRLLTPRALGLTHPTRLFWSFLEGFEEGLESWRVLAPEGARLHPDSTARMGRTALAVTLPEGKHSVTVGTTRLRPWHLWKLDYHGVRVWLRTREGAGRVRCSLLTNAYTTNQAVAVFPREVRFTNQWTRVDLPFAEYPQFAHHAVDVFALEFIGDGPQEFLVDDLQLLGADNREF